MTIGELRSAINGLPQLDFYVPFKSQRLTWSGTGDVIVGYVMANDQVAINAFDTSGAASDFVADPARAPNTTLVLLEPAETKSKRIKRQARVDGPTIQDADDGELSGTITYTDRNGKVQKKDLADVPGGGPGGGITIMGECLDCPPDEGGGGSGGEGTLYLHSIHAYYGDGVGSAELEYTTSRSGRSSVTLSMRACHRATLTP